MKKQFSRTAKSVAVMVGLLVAFNTNAQIVQSHPVTSIHNERDASLAAEKQAQGMTSVSLQVLNLIDQGKSGEVWDGLSPSIKPLVSKNSFTQRIKTDQSLFGSAVKRERLSAYRSDINGQSNIPQGVYYSVVFMTGFTKGQGRELVSFRLDDDQTWRVAGYSLTRATDK